MVACSAAWLVASACSGSSDSVDAAQRRVAQAQEALAEANAALEQAGTAFCAEAKDYIGAIDRYGKIFDEQVATVGDLKKRWEPTSRSRGRARSPLLRQSSTRTTL